MQFFLIFLTALVFSVIGTPLARRLGLLAGVVSIPNARRINTVPVPQLGGAAMYLAFIVGLLLFGERAEIRQLVAILLGATLMSLLGLIDDRWELHAGLKLVGQIGAALMLIASGLHVQLLHSIVLDSLLTITWVVGITNALNLLDNMDGLSGGVAAVAAANFLLLAALNPHPQFLVGGLAAALLGACLGFLRYNLNPATIFMGDTGSLFIGFILAAVGIKLRFANTNAVTWMVPLIVLAVPLFDTTLVFVSRLRRGRNPLTTPGKDHVSHRLVALGLTRREAVLTCWIIGFAAGMVATFLTKATILQAYAVGAALLASGIVGIAWLERRAPGGL
ncbi:MAG: undecaprenyl/decaprenyl-phosphate alpha-N-acetylglucosaminyl 1-phosphate transferase [Herpetosiphonaceae bacterium]|nr:undecaprenyl/decaprenyl-phosphate alpha-N-acetylglucosaminyl 1-phosphate transferase [Herpetosiphonaceae bacterium]